MSDPSTRLHDLAVEYSFAKNVKEAARIRIQCTKEEWALVLEEAKKIYNNRVK